MGLYRQDGKICLESKQLIQFTLVGKEDSNLVVITIYIGKNKLFLPQAQKQGISATTKLSW
jgi:hypothetical protein